MRVSIKRISQFRNILSYPTWPVERLGDGPWNLDGHPHAEQKESSTSYDHDVSSPLVRDVAGDCNSKGFASSSSGLSCGEDKVDLFIRFFNGENSIL